MAQAEIQGTTGDDTITPGLGNYAVYGLAGTDLLIVDYSSETFTGSESFVPGLYWTNNGDGSGGGGVYIDAAGNRDGVSFSGIEHTRVTGTQFHDEIQGGSPPGSDSIYGGGGNDLLSSCGIGDVFSGGEGFDTLDSLYFASASAPITLNESGSTQTLPGGGSITSIERIDRYLFLGFGADRITLTTTTNNEIYCGAGNDTINPGRGHDTVDGDAGSDLLIADYSANSFTGTSQYAAGLRWTNNQDGSGGGSVCRNSAGDYDGVTFSEVERMQITGTRFADFVHGNLNGLDTISAGAGNDTLVYYSSGDVLSGGSGTDFLDRIELGSRTTRITLNESGDTLAMPGGGTISQVERFIGIINLGSAPDTVRFASIADSTISGGLGADTVNAGRGRDQVNGDDGTDLLIVDYSNNSFSGNASYAAGLSLINNGDGTGSCYAYRSSTGDFDQVGFQGVETFRVTGTRFGDSMEGGALRDTLNGGFGADNLYGGGGSDSLLGGDGIDTLTGAPQGALGEKDTLKGGAHRDLFVVGTAAGQCYDDALSNNVGRADYAFVQDFLAGTDKLQLAGSASQYYLGASGVSGVSGKGVYFEKGETDELIAIVRSADDTSLTKSNVISTAVFV